MMIGNDRMRDLQGLGRLRSVGGALSISGHTKLLSLDGLSAVQEVGRSVSIERNPLLTSVDQLLSWPANAIAEELRLTANPELSECQAQQVAQSLAIECSCLDNLAESCE